MSKKNMLICEDCGSIRRDSVFRVCGNWGCGGTDFKRKRMEKVDVNFKGGWFSSLKKITTYKDSKGEKYTITEDKGIPDY